MELAEADARIHKDNNPTHKIGDAEAAPHPEDHATQDTAKV